MAFLQQNVKAMYLMKMQCRARNKNRVGERTIFIIYVKHVLQHLNTIRSFVSWNIISSIQIY